MTTLYEVHSKNNGIFYFAELDCYFLILVYKNFKLSAIDVTCIVIFIALRNTSNHNASNKKYYVLETFRRSSSEVYNKIERTSFTF